MMPSFKFDFNFCLAFLLLVFISSCQNADRDIESAHVEVMRIHDEVMPKQSEISAAQLSLKKWIGTKDSSFAIPGEISSTLDMLANAEEAMWAWMNNYSKPKSEEDHSSALQYLKNQEESITIVKDQMLKSLESYDVLKEKFNF